MFVNSKSSHIVIKLPWRSSADTNPFETSALILSLPKSQTERSNPLSHPNASFSSLALNCLTWELYSGTWETYYCSPRTQENQSGQPCIYPPWLLTLSCLVRWGLLVTTWKQRILPALGAPTILSLVNAQLEEEQRSDSFQSPMGLPAAHQVRLQFLFFHLLVELSLPLGEKIWSYITHEFICPLVDVNRWNRLLGHHVLSVPWLLTIYVITNKFGVFKSCYA